MNSGPLKDQKGKRYGKLTVLGLSDFRKHGHLSWDCLCDCGKTTVKNTGELRSGHAKTCGCQRGKVVVGGVYGLWTVLSFVGRQGSSNVYLCRCECGKEKTRPARYLLAGRHKSCGCTRAAALRESSKKRHVSDRDAFKRMFLWRYKDGARARNLSWDISDEHALALARSDCHYCGAKPSFKKGDRTSGYGEEINGIDRVDNSKGYSLENCRPACVDCNHSKSSNSLEHFLDHAKRIAMHQGWISHDPIPTPNTDMSLQWTVM